MTVRVSANRTGLWLGAGVLVVVLAVAAVLGVRWWSDRADGALAGQRLTSFPAVDRSALDADQRALVAVLERQFDDPGSGPDYAEGVVEAWCADFVSWVMREAGRPLSNPNSGSWRIPGVYTLQEYYQSVDRFVPIEAADQPRTGDVLLYGPDSSFGHHTNIVLAADNGTVTTIGGNEFGRVSIHRFRLAEVPDVVGYGRF
ncbi:CHAP domain-containing protein [Nocardia higoensis]|uniref:CHAP domain-containing protein n=1 Tax=Nocardia higoensis TaxID=228599 RepID=UPI000594A614|nr:CHAP domain-containing protein [Nocardia higoensis]